MSERAPRTVHLPDPDGGPDIDLVPSIKTWEAIEDKYGALGALYIEQRLGRVRFRFMTELVWRCARQAGSTLTAEQIGARCYGLGIHRLADVVDALWLDIMKPTEAEPTEGDAATAGTPLANGG